MKSSLRPSTTAAEERGPVLISSQGQSPAPDLTKQQIERMLQAVDSEPDKARRWNMLQKVRDLSYSLRFPYGFGKYWPVAVAGASALSLALFINSRTEKVDFYRWPENYLRVIETLDPCLPDGTCGYRRSMQNVEFGIPGEVTEMHFCKKPRFEGGHTLKWIRLVNMGSCYAIDGFDVLRDGNGVPVLAPNCDFDWPNNHIACDGGKAKF